MTGIIICWWVLIAESASTKGYIVCQVFYTLLLTPDNSVSVADFSYFISRKTKLAPLLLKLPIIYMVHYNYLKSYITNVLEYKA